MKKSKQKYFKIFFVFLFVFNIIFDKNYFFANTTDNKIKSLINELYSQNLLNKSQENEILSTAYWRIRFARERNYSSNLYNKNFTYANLDGEKSTDKQKIFNQIFEQNFWNNYNSDESRSGPGSRICSTQNICEKIPELLEKYNIKSILDAPCGDYNWMRTVDKKGAKYIGGDIVPKVIRQNKQKYKDDNTEFRVLDICEDKIPQVDMILCRDCLQHLSYKNVKKALKNFKDSGSTYLLVTSYPLTLDNWDINNGDYRPLNLFQKPFNLQKNYLEAIAEVHVNGNEFDKTMYLYKLDDINIDLFEDDSKNKVNTIPIAMALDNNYLYPTIVSITSIMENSNYKVKHDFYIMHPENFSQENKNKLLSLQEKYDNCTINLIDMGDKYRFAKSDRRITTPAYYRLSLSDLLPNLDKIIWLDGDTVVYGDLTEMFNVDMNGYCYKGFLDFPSHSIYIKEQFNTKTVSNNFICSGTMVINLNELRNNNATQKFDEFISKYNDKLVQHDQTVINALFSDKIGILPAKFGLWKEFGDKKESASKWSDFLISPEKYTSQEMIDAHLNPVVVHLTGKKSWKSPDTPEKATCDWWRYAEQSGFLSEIQEKYLIPNGTYEIASALNENMVFDIYAASKKNGTKLQLFEKNNTNAQKFEVNYDKDGYFTIRSKCSGKLIDVPAATKNSDVQLNQWEDNNTDAQKWYILPNGDGTFKIISKCNGLYVDIRGAETKNFTPVQCYRSNNTKAQKFKFKK